MSFIKNDISALSGDVFQKIGNEWMLIAAEKEGKVNTMTASWGGVGVLWGENVAFVFIRPQRYTFEFTENTDYMTLSFFGGKYKKELGYLGTNSGRDGDKIGAVDFHIADVDGHPSFEEAETVLVCRKLYADTLREASFIDKEMLKNYTAGDFHRVYVVKIESVYTKA